MKVMHIETGMHLYGGAQQVVYLLRDLNEMQVTNILVCCKDSEIEKSASDFYDSCSLLPESGILVVSMIRALKKIIKKEKPDLIHVHSRRLGIDLLAGIAARFSGVPAIISRRVDNPEKPWAAKLKYQPYQKIITISEGIRQVLLKQDLKAEKVVTVRSAVNAEPFQHGCDRKYFLKEFNLPEDSITIAVIAQLIHRKGHRHLLKILPEIINQYPQLNVLFFGKGALEIELENLIWEKQLNSVKMVGFRKDLSRWMSCLDVVVHPADMEGLGVSLLQASAAGVPVIASRAGGMPEIVRDQENGLLIEPGDTKALASALSELLGNKSLRLQMGKNGQDLIAKEFSTKIMAEGNLAVYRQVLS